MISRAIFAFLIISQPLTTNCQENSGFSLGKKQLVPNNPPVLTANATGTYGIGARRETLTFDDRELNVSWWYPANASPQSTKYITSGGISGQAFKDVPLNQSGGPYPLIILSPGLGARDDAYYFYLQNLASHGYIVVSINHLDATESAPGAPLAAMMKAAADMLANNSSHTVWLLFSNWFRSTHFALTYRPQEIQFVLDKAVATATDTSSPFYEAIDTNNIGMTGHSLGAFYAMVKGGGMSINCDYALTAEENNTANQLLDSVNICAWPEAKALSSPTALHDPRIKAVIALASPVFIKPAQMSRSAATITTPLMILSGNDPRYESTLSPQQQVYDSAKGPKYMVEVNATDHLLVSEAYEFNSELSRLVPAGNKANFTEKAEVYMVYSAAFFDVYLKGNKSRKEALHKPSSSFVGGLKYLD
jgi:predicted dienelactone hydrolase